MKSALKKVSKSSVSKSDVSTSQSTSQSTSRSTSRSSINESQTSESQTSNSETKKKSRVYVKDHETGKQIRVTVDDIVTSNNRTGKKPRSTVNTNTEVKTSDVIKTGKKPKIITSDQELELKPIEKKTDDIKADVKKNKKKKTKKTKKIKKNKKNEKNEQIEPVHNGTCYNIYCKYVTINENGTENKYVRETPKDHIILKDNEDVLLYKQRCQHHLTYTAKKHNRKLLEFVVVPCVTCHSEKRRCYIVSYSFYDKNEEYKYYEPHHFQNNNENLTKKEIMSVFKDKVKNMGGTGMNITVKFCGEKEDELSYFESFMGWLFFG